MKDYPLSELSLFFPCYNEEKNIETTFNKAIPTIIKTAKKWEIILINDGSTDNTAQILLKLKAKYPNNVKIITHPQNRGYGAAFKSGLYGAKYQWIALNDADGQFDFKDIQILIKTQKATGTDMVIGYYLTRKVPFVRILGSKAWQIIVFILFGLWVTDNDCGFKLINKRVVDVISNLEAERGPFITSEFLIKAKKAKFTISEVGVHHFPRLYGDATGTKLNVIIGGFKDLFNLWLKLKNTG